MSDWKDVHITIDSTNGKGVHQLRYRDIPNQADEIMRQYQALVGGSWRNVSGAEFDRGRLGVISNQQTTQKMVKQIKYPWVPTGQQSKSGQHVFVKTFPSKDSKTGKIRQSKAYAVESGGRMIKVSKFFIETGMHPMVGVRKSGPRRATVGNRAYHLGGATKAQYLKARRMFLAAETPKQRRADRRTMEPLVYTAAQYNPLVNDFPGIDEPVGRKRWSAKAGDYVSPKARTVSEYQRAVMKWARTGKVGPKPVRVGPEPAYLIKKRARAAAKAGTISPALAAAIVDLPSVSGAKRGRDDDDGPVMKRRY